MLNDQRIYHALIEWHKNIFNTESSLISMFVRESDNRERITRNSETPKFVTIQGNAKFWKYSVLDLVRPFFQSISLLCTLSYIFLFME